MDKPTKKEKWAYRPPAARRSGVGRENDANSPPRPPRRFPPLPKHQIPQPHPIHGPLILTLRRDEILPAGDGDTDTGKDGRFRIQDCELVASFNWLDGDGDEPPSIVIPGKPPRWAPPAEPAQLRPDAGLYYRDRNAARWPRHPMEPAVVAYLEAAATAGDPHSPFSHDNKVDVFACGSTLGNLLRFTLGSNLPFCMLIEKVCGTVFLVRRENSPTELIPDVRGYGHNFPEAYTSWDRDVEGSSSSHRLIKYRFGGMTFVVRFEADGYLPDDATDDDAELKAAPEKAGPEKIAASKGEETGSMDDLSVMMARASISPTQGPGFPAPAGDGAISITRRGSGAADPIDQSRIFDIKTRSVRNRGVHNVLDQELKRLWVAQIPNFILAYHANGFFPAENIEVQDVRENVRRWEVQHVGFLARLASLVRRVVSLVGERPDGKMELFYRGGGAMELEVREKYSDSWSVLGERVRAEWVRQAAAYGDDGTDSGDDGAIDGVDGIKDENGVDDSSDATPSDGIPEWDSDPGEDYTECGPGCGYCGDCRARVLPATT